MRTRAFFCLFILSLLALTPTHAQEDGFEIITAENAAQLEQVVDFGSESAFNHLEWSADGSMLALGDSSGIWLYDANDWNAAPSFIESDSIHQIAFGWGYLAFSDESGTHLWDTSDITEIDTLTDFPLAAIAFDPDGITLALQDRNSVRRIQVGTWLTLDIFELPYDGVIESLVFQGSVIAAVWTNGEGTGVYIWSVDTRMWSDSLEIYFDDPVLENANSIAFSTNGHTIAVSKPDNDMLLLDLETNETTLYTGENLCNLSFSPNASLLTASDETNTYIWNAESDDEALLTLENEVNGNFSPTGIYFATTKGVYSIPSHE